MENIYTTDKNNLKIKLLCKKSFGDFKDGRYFEKGKEYNTKLEIYPLNTMEDMRSIFISYNIPVGGERFSITNNLNNMTNFREYFYCPLERERLLKIKKIRKNELV